MIAQIYEIQDPSEAQKCIEVGVEHIGSVLLSIDAWKVASIKNVVQLCRESGVKSSIIPLFLEKEAVYRVGDYYQPDILHFCENLVGKNGELEDLEGAAELQFAVKTRFPEIALMRSIPVPVIGSGKNTPWKKIVEVLTDVSDIFLIDTWVGAEPVNGFIGITGETADWNISAEIVKESKIPVILAGGLSPENVYKALLKVRPYGADSCTQTNMVDGEGNPVRFKKDIEKVKKFVREIRRAEQALLSTSG